MQVFVFGHSITYGCWDAEGGWVQRLRSFLDEKSLENTEKYYFEIYNLGVPGDDSGQLLQRFDREIESRHSEDDETVIIFQIGANDAVYMEEEDRPRVSRESFEKNLTELVEKAREYTGKVLIVGEGYTTISGAIPWRPEHYIDDSRLGNYVKVQRKVSLENEVSFIDLRSQEMKEWVRTLEDGIHPDMEGHEKIFEEVKEKMLEEELLDF